jgi:hypothetical protein
MITYIKKMWDGDNMVSRQAGLYGKPFNVWRVVCIGDTHSLILFNIIVDAIIRDIEAYQEHPNMTTQQLLYAGTME